MSLQKEYDLVLFLTEHLLRGGGGGDTERTQVVSVTRGIHSLVGQNSYM